MSKQPVSMLRIAVRDLQSKASEKSDEKSEPSVDALEQAMSDFEKAGTPKERAAAFRAALELAKAD